MAESALVQLDRTDVKQCEKKHVPQLVQVLEEVMVSIQQSREVLGFTPSMENTNLRYHTILQMQQVWKSVCVDM